MLQNKRMYQDNDKVFFFSHKLGEGHHGFAFALFICSFRFLFYYKKYLWAMVIYIDFAFSM
jgi:hypothetical protein